MSQARPPATKSVSSAIWVEPNFLSVRLEIASLGKMRFVVDAAKLKGTPLEGWSADMPVEAQWRATNEKPADDEDTVIWVSGVKGTKLRESRMIELLIIAREDMSDEERRDTSSWAGKLILLEEGFHNYGVFDILDDLALRIAPERRQFQTRLALDEAKDLVLSAVSLDERNQLLCRSSAQGIEYELLDLSDGSGQTAAISGLWTITDIQREKVNDGFHAAIDQFITLSPPPSAQP